MGLLHTIGQNCQRVLESKMQGVRANFVQADEAWSFVHSKEKHRRAGDPQEWGDQYIWVALDSENKTILTYHVGKRDGQSAYEFIDGLRRRVDGRFQLTTDGLDKYIAPVEEHFGCDVDYAQLVKIYGQPEIQGPDWYRPAPTVIGTFRRYMAPLDFP
jgi:IS1 family transposase